jgi:AcrR family transcriptional regulator
MGRPPANAAAPATAERLLDAAEQAFATQGYGGARLEDIAAAAGIRRPSLLYHYPSKDALYAAVVRRTFARLGRALSDAMARDVGFDGRLAAVVRGYADFIADNPGMAQILLRELLDAQGPGQELLLGEVAPLLDVVERFVRIEGRGSLRRGVPVRAAILQVASGIILRSAAGELQEPLWGAEDHAWTLARVLFFEEERACPSTA